MYLRGKPGLVKLGHVKPGQVKTGVWQVSGGYLLDVKSGLFKSRKVKTGQVK